MRCAILLPFPPGLNNLFKNIRRGRARTDRYQAWIAEATRQILAQNPQRICGSFRAELRFERPDRRKRDLDGLAKAPLDLLVRAGVIDDDHLAERLVLVWSDVPPSKPGSLLVMLEACS
ncbi:MAG: RusA family crossover junction endodeoxyribonuclease [Lentisphaeria bacterium]|jgi:Holliday junction resolvase RusA-like endonuclease|nr:RusA family crossover junction endodeoxyribonuclease [Lentisphaeria bacterium]